jgi:hypothetical protein
MGVPERECADTRRAETLPRSATEGVKTLGEYAMAEQIRLSGRSDEIVDLAKVNLFR